MTIISIVSYGLVLFLIALIYAKKDKSIKQDRDGFIKSNHLSINDKTIKKYRKPPFIFESYEHHIEKWQYEYINEGNENRLLAKYYNESGEFEKSHIVIDFGKNKFPKTQGDYEELELVHEFGFDPHDEKLLSINTGEIDLKTGKIVCFELSSFDSWEDDSDEDILEMSSFCQDVKPGNYPIYHKYKAYKSFTELAFVIIKLSDFKTEKYIRALVKNKLNLEEVFDESHHSIESDHMGNAISDLSYFNSLKGKGFSDRSKLALDINDQINEQYRLKAHPDSEYNVYGWFNYKGEDINLNYFVASGYGSSIMVCPCYFGLDENNNKTEFIISVLNY